jgi:hypothetical protein
MGKSFHSGNSVTHQGKTNTWFTPEKYTKPLGEFDLDPCTQSFRPYNIAHNNICEDLGECGLSREWEGRVWLNPPYGKEIGKWLEKMSKHGNGIALVFARCETKWAQKAFSECDAVFFIKGRISFIPSMDLTRSSAANGNMFLIWGEENVRKVLLSGIDGVCFLNKPIEEGIL